MNRIQLSVIGAAFLFFISCRPAEDPVSLELPSTPILTSESLWGVANKPYLKVLETPDQVSGLNGLLRQGDIVRIISKVGAQDGRLYWLEIQLLESNTRGWIPDDSMDIYDSPAQAHTARAGMLAQVSE